MKFSMKFRIKFAEFKVILAFCYTTKENSLNKIFFRFLDFFQIKIRKIIIIILMKI